jgi:hypothetical protein
MNNGAGFPLEACGNDIPERIFFRQSQDIALLLNPRIPVGTHIIYILYSSLEALQGLLYHKAISRYGFMEKSA